MTGPIPSPEAQAAQDATKRAFDEARYQVGNALVLLAYAATALDGAEGMLAADERQHQYPSPAAQHMMARVAEASGAISTILRSLKEDADLAEVERRISDGSTLQQMLAALEAEKDLVEGGDVA
ncbi:hypothetical protein [Methylobacterium nodulans]|uniref:Uncharacterized protein n=1 Tax=Methylobacterium nodulans (strain LMG 21967 / CNCM I-2342 / ORS 2060) TaxID=460265 RepID=B8IT72_METNO|nr:hypothetical protein [Methylobacterium nodulans]ACL56958.1 hypothetical protein Mnod_1970 [Methylobacterium nodulans ORS 2060]